MTTAFQQDFIAPALDIVSVLENEAVPGPEKLVKVEDNLVVVFEAGDDLAVSVLPPVVREIAHFAVDNPVVDNWQRVLVARPVAEIVVQVYKAATGALETASDFVKGIVMPARAVIVELASDTQMTGAEKRAALEARILAVLEGIENIVDFLPGGLRDFARVLLSSEIVSNIRKTIAGFLGEVLYQVWAFLHAHPSAPAAAFAQ
jgi:hypothetical protein